MSRPSRQTYSTHQGQLPLAGRQLFALSYSPRSLQRYMWQTLTQIDCTEINAAQIDTLAVRAAHDVQRSRPASRSSSCRLA
jgi:hypothetical protein